MPKKKTHEEYVAEVAVINPNIEVVGTYAGNKIEILHRCKIDQYEWMARPNNILNNHGCPMCGGVKRRTHEEYVAYVASEHPDIEVIGAYINAHTPILHRCTIDDCEWMTEPNNILKDHGCPKCAGVKKKTHNEYVSEVAVINKNIEVVGIYVDARTKILHKCKIDGCNWMAKPDWILRGSGCPKCNTSKGENAIADWLSKKNIVYKPQETFDDCKDKYVLRFDFYLPDYNILIEYNGKQHYEPIDFFGGQEGFEKNVKRDKIKENYCKENNITLIKIPYFADVYEELEKMYELIINKEAIA